MVLKLLAVLTVRNEGAFLLEWLAHHRAAGFTDFLVFSNDCQDGTDTMLDRLAAMGWLTHVRNDGPYDKAGIQFTALKQAEKLDIVKSADWILTLDIDEFVNVKTGDHTLPALLAALPEATAITLTWRLFGNAGVQRYVDATITETFTRCAPNIIFWPWRAAMFKTLYRNDGSYKKLGVHRPRSPDKTRLDQARWFDGEGRELGPEFKTQRIFSNYGRSNSRLVQLNHYPLGAMESYVLKSDRGRVNRSDLPLGMDYWVERNFNTDTDTTINSLAQARAPILESLHADPALGALHQDAVNWRQKRFKELMTEETFRSLYSRLMMAPASIPIPVDTARELIGHAMRSADTNKI